jgi:hypothetical protein
MPLYASISDLTIDLAWVQSLKSVDYNAGAATLTLTDEGSVNTVTIREVRA